MADDEPDGENGPANASIGVTGLTKKDRTALYAAARYLDRDTLENLHLRIPFAIYFKDPAVAKEYPGVAIDSEFHVPWEPGITDGPTSARFAVVDYDSTTNKLEKPAQWNAGDNAFYDPDGAKLDEQAKNLLHFRQVSTWAVVQNALDFFESGWGLGRRILWGFEGNRLIVVPHAGYGENAYYDRKSKSLQFYYFDDDDGNQVQTCLSSDIVYHEFGHAVLDGVHPYYLEAVSPQTAAFHEFIGDLTAILLVFRNNSFREEFVELTGGKVGEANILANLAQQFGEAVDKRPYLRTGANDRTMASLEGDLEPHRLSEVMTGTMFEFLAALSKQYAPRPTKLTVSEALAHTVQRMWRMAIQPLDLLPPVEVTFRDYALAVLRAEQIANPTDPQGYRPMLLDIFIKRGILQEAERPDLLAVKPVFERMPLAVLHSPEVIAASRANAYRFLDDNRKSLFIPARADIIISDVFTAEKLNQAGQRQPRQILLQYVWRQDVFLDGPQFGRFDGQTTSLLCGATLALDENGNILHWARKPGSETFDGTDKPQSQKWAAEQQAGRARLAAYLDVLAKRIQAGMVGDSLGGALGLLERSIPPLTSRTVDGMVRFELSPHFSIHGHDDDEHLGERQWQISS